jgi:polyhydroxybutyrate depolymerase
MVIAVTLAGAGCQRHQGAQAASPDTVHQLSVGGLHRSYLVHQPSGTASMAGLPVVIAFAGGFGTDSGMASLTHLDQVADQHRFVVVYPEGYRRSWNDGRGSTPASQAGVNDVAFVSAIIASLVASDHVDARRVYATGISNGGMFTELLGCDLAGKLAGIAPVAGPMPAQVAPGCHPARPVPVLVIHGTSDPIVPYAGGHVNGRGGGGTVLPA